MVDLALRPPDVHCGVSEPRAGLHSVGIRIPDVQPWRAPDYRRSGYGLHRQVFFRPPVIHCQTCREDDMSRAKVPLNCCSLQLRRSHLLLLTAAMLAAVCAPIASAQVSSDLYSGMRWRLIGPHRAGRVTAVAGIAGQPNEYYFGT